MMLTDEEDEEVCVVCDAVCICRKKRKSSLTSIIGSLSDLSLSPVSFDFHQFVHQYTSSSHSQSEQQSSHSKQAASYAAAAGNSKISKSNPNKNRTYQSIEKILFSSSPDGNISSTSINTISLSDSIFSSSLGSLITKSVIDSDDTIDIESDSALDVDLNNKNSTTKKNKKHQQQQSKSNTNKQHQEEKKNKKNTKNSLNSVQHTRVKNSSNKDDIIINGISTIIKTKTKVTEKQQRQQEQKKKQVELFNDFSTEWETDQEPAEHEMMFQMEMDQNNKKHLNHDDETDLGDIGNNHHQNEFDAHNYMIIQKQQQTAGNEGELDHDELDDGEYDEIEGDSNSSHFPHGNLNHDQEDDDYDEEGDELIEDENDEHDEDEEEEEFDDEEDIGVVINENEWHAAYSSDADSFSFLYNIHGDSFDEDDGHLDETDLDELLAHLDTDTNPRIIKISSPLKTETATTKTTSIKQNQYSQNIHGQSSCAKNTINSSTFPCNDQNIISTVIAIKENSETEEEDFEDDIQNNEQFNAVPHIYVDKGTSSSTDEEHSEDEAYHSISLPELVKELSSSEDQEEPSPKVTPLNKENDKISKETGHRPPLLNVPPFFPPEALRHLEQFTAANYRHSGIDAYNPMATAAAAAALAAYNALSSSVLSNHQQPFPHPSPHHMGAPLPPHFPAATAAQQDRSNNPHHHVPHFAQPLPSIPASYLHHPNNLQQKHAMAKKSSPLKISTLANPSAANVSHSETKNPMMGSKLSKTQEALPKVESSKENIPDSTESLKETKRVKEVLDMDQGHHGTESRQRKRKMRAKPKISLKIEDLLDVAELLEESDTEASIYVPTEWVRWQKVPIGSYRVHRKANRRDDSVYGNAQPRFMGYLPTLETTLVPASDDHHALLSPVFPDSMSHAFIPSRNHHHHHHPSSRTQSKWHEEPFMDCLSSSSSPTSLDPPSRVSNIDGGHTSLISYLSASSSNLMQDEKGYWKKTKLNDLNLYPLDAKDFSMLERHSNRPKRKRRKKSVC